MNKRGTKKFLSRMLAWLLVFVMLPIQGFVSNAAETNTDAELTAAMAEAKSYIDGITINNSSNDPETVVKNFKTHFTWDNEKRENSKSYLFDWSYYNGVVFEGLEYVYEVTKEEAYKNYVVEYMSSLIASNGTWATCSNNSSKQCAGYNSTHGADCYKTASLLLDAYEMTNDGRYLTMANTLYADLDSAANNKDYSLANAGNNYRHTWASDPSPDLWLDGLYMILPFRAEYAKHIGDTEELDLIVSRMQWVSDNMYNSSKGLFYHAADSASSNSGTYWLRSIGWYAAAIVDVMDSMEGQNLETMKAQLVKLVDGMKACQNSSNGMWLNNMNASQSSSNPYETSGTALVCYAVMKAVNEGWLDSSYADMAILAFKGICKEKLNGSNLTDICFKGAPGSSNSTFYDNEGKGVGPFIMLYAEVMEYQNKLAEEETPVVTPADKTVTLADGTTIKATAVLGDISITEVSEVDKALIEKEEYEAFLAYDIAATLPENGTTTISISVPVPADWNVTEDDRLVGISVKDGAVETIQGTLKDGVYSFSVNYFSAKGIALIAEEIEEEVPADKTATAPDGTEIKITDVIGEVVVTEVSNEDKTLIEETLIKDDEYEAFVAYDMKATLAENGKAMISIPVPTEWNATAEELVGISVEEGELKKIPGTLEDGVYSFEVSHFSAKGIALIAEDTEETGNWVSGESSTQSSYIYTLDTDGINYGNENRYLIVARNDAYVLTANGTNTSVAKVEIKNNTITLNTKEYEWAFIQNSKQTGDATYNTLISQNNGSTWLYHTNNNMYVNKYSVTPDANRGYWKLEGHNSGYYQLTDYDWKDWRLYYNNGKFTVADSNGSNNYVRLFGLTGTTGTGVTFKVSPKTGSVLVGENQDFIYEIVLADGTTVESSSIKWESDTTSIATVNNGRVTGVADGTANIIATLSAVNGTSLQEDIVLTIPVTIKSKQILSATLTGNTTVTTTKNVEPNFSNIRLEIKYDDNSTETITIDNGLVIEGYDVTTVGSSVAKISYNGTVYGTVRVIVEGDPYEGKEVATQYPEYPEEGAVRIDKTATEIDFENTGVVQVELGVAGISVKPAVDVILVTDLSNSMAWSVGGRTDATSHEATKMYDLQQSINSFADIFLAKDEDGNATNNTISLVTFGGYDAEYTNKVYDGYADSTQTLLVGERNAEKVKNVIGSIRVLADDVLDIGTCTSGYYLSFDGGKTYGENYGNTNYDHAFMQTADAISKLKTAYKEVTETEYDESGRQIYVLFMTDGAPSNYDGVYYAYKTGDRADVNCTWKNSQGKKVTYTMGNNTTAYKDAEWYQYIAGGTYNATKDTIPGNPLYWADQVYKTQGVTDIYSIGFDIDNGGFSSMTFTKEDGRPLLKVLEKLVTGETLKAFKADDATSLSAVYTDLATKIRYAGTQANVTDIVKSDFDLQLTQTTGSSDATVNGDLGFKPTITISAYELWTKEETDNHSLIGSRKTNEDGSYVCNVIETVTFNDNGTAAYSSLIENGTKNIMTEKDGTIIIEAFYFTYKKTADSVETFKWHLGNITEKEVVLSYYAYLTGSLEGKRPKGLYYTNEEAKLEYIDINEKYATQIFPVPAVVWGGASTSYEFYLVNENGQPCDRNGTVIPFANRVIITGPYYEELYLNQKDEEVAKEITAAYVIPASYTLYDASAKYTVVTASGDISGSLQISEPAEGKEQTTIVVSAVTPSYIQSRVAFGVLYNKIPNQSTFELTPDEVVIDYGKSIVIDIANDNKDLENGYEATLVGFSKYYANVDLKTKFASTSAIDNFVATYGVFKIEDAENSKVRYTPTKFVDSVEKIFCVIKMYNAAKNDTYYMVDKLSVIPATSVYYETDFAAGVFAITAPTESAWGIVDDGTEPDDDNVQDDGTIGQNPTQTYGYDSSYENDTYLSNKTSYYVEGAGYNSDNTPKTYVEFSFVGNGFEVISRTGEMQGLIKVEVFDKDGVSEKTISVLNKSESKLELYQIPVVSINDLNYGTHNVRISVDNSYTASIPILSSLNRGNEFYFDAIRVFEPAWGNVEAEAAYAMDNEANRQLTEVRSLLLTQGAFNELGNASEQGMIFLDREKDLDEEQNESLEVTNHNTPYVATYETIGPNNETYLAKGQAIAFKVNANSIPASVDIGAKSITGAATELTATITNNNGTSMTTVKSIASSTAQNINLLKNAKSTNTIFSSDNVYVVITNTGDGVLSITDIKVAYDSGTAAVMSARAYNPYEVTYTVDAGTFALARTVLMSSIEETDNDLEQDVPEQDVPEEEEPVVEANYDILNGSTSTVGEKKDQKTIITIETTQDVVRLEFVEGKKKVDSKDIVFEDNEDGTRIWTLTITKAGAGDKTYIVTGYGEDGTNGASMTLTPPEKTPEKTPKKTPKKTPEKTPEDPKKK